MNTKIDLIVLTPAVAGVFIRYLVGRRLRIEDAKRGVLNITGVQTYSYSRKYLDIIFILAIIVPLAIMILPDSIVSDVRSLFNLFAVVVSLILLFSWTYLRNYKIVVNYESIEYGAFRTKHVVLADITAIKYHWVNNGISLKLFSGGKVIAIFEGGISRFDDFAKCVRSRLSNDVHVETVGNASF